MHLVGFIIRMYHDARSSECRTCCTSPDVDNKQYQFHECSVFLAQRLTVIKQTKEEGQIEQE